MRKNILLLSLLLVLSLLLIACQGDGGEYTTPRTAHTAPAFLQADEPIYGQTLTVSWEAVTHTTLYILEVKAGNGDFYNLYAGSSNEAQYVVTTMQELSFRVKARRSGYNDSPYYTTDTYQVEKAERLPPEFPAYDAGKDYIILDYVLGAEYSLDGNQFYESREFSSLSPGTQYTVCIRYKETATHKRSPHISSTISTLRQDAAVLPAPQGLRAEAAPAFGDTFTLIWNAVQYASGYKLERKDGENWTQIYSGNALSYTASEPVNDMSDLVFRVSALGDGLDYMTSAYTQQKFTVERAIAQPPANVTAESGADTITVKFYANALYNIDGGNFGANNVFMGLEDGREYIVGIKFAQTDTHMESETVYIKITTLLQCDEYECNCEKQCECHHCGELEGGTPHDIIPFPAPEIVTGIAQATSGTGSEVYHDQGGIYLSDIQPSSSDAVTMRLRLSKGYGHDKIIRVRYTTNYTSTMQTNWSEQAMVYEGRDVTDRYEFFIATVPAQSTLYAYQFRIGNRYYGFETDSQYNARRSFKIVPGFSTPDWAKGTLWYSIMPDSFYNGDIFNDKWSSGGVSSNAWGGYHFGGSDYFGGDLQGIIDQLDYLRSLGVESVFLNPIWLSTHQAGYGSYDFTQVDSAFGNEQKLKELIGALHDQEMQIMLDAVFEYAAEHNIWFNRYGAMPLAALDDGTPQNRIFKRDSKGNIRYSVWGPPLIEFDSEYAKGLIYKNTDSVIQTYIREYGIDAWRFDVGESLTGTNTSNAQLLRDIRQYIKQANPNTLFLSEHGPISYSATNNIMTSGTLDSKWNYNFYTALVGFMEGYNPYNSTTGRITAYDGDDRYSGKKLGEALSSAVLRMPRQAALTSYNFISGHDTARFLQVVEGDAAKMMMAQIVLMTYVGSPVIFYGDELGTEFNPYDGSISPKAPVTFSAMDWNEKNTDTRLFNLQRALGELRHDYAGALKYGNYITLRDDDFDAPNAVFAYGRYDADSKVVVIANKSQATLQSFSLSVASMSIPDGYKLRDYLTGREYTVTDGAVVVDVYPGGVVLVSGNAGNFVGEFEIQYIGESNATVRGAGALGDLLLEGGAWINSTDDTLTITGKTVLDNGSVSATFDYAGSGKAGLMLRGGIETGAAFYAAIFDGVSKEVVITARTAYGQNAVKIGVYPVTNDFDMRIVREGRQFGLYINGVIMQDSVVAATMGNTLFGGAFSLKGSTLLGKLRVENLFTSPFDSFDEGGSLLSFSSPDTYSFSGGNLLLSSQDGVIVKGYANPVSGDFTFKSDMAFQPFSSGQFAGIMVAQGDTGVFVGKYRYPSFTEIIAGIYHNGQFSVYGRHADISGSAVYQLERTGNSYRAYIVAGESVYLVADGIVANFSLPRAQVCVSGRAVATFNYVSFGNAIEDNISITHHLFSQQAFDFYSISAGNPYQVIGVTGGEFEYVTGGIRQKLNTGASALTTNLTGGEFKAEFTLTPHTLSGHVGLQMGGFSIRLESGGMFSLFTGNSRLKSAQIQGFELDKTYRIVVVATGGKLFAYLNDILLLDYSGLSLMGAVSVSGLDASYTLTNYNFFNVDNAWQVYHGNVSFSAGQLTVTANGAGGIAYFANRNTVFNNFIFTTDVTMASYNNNPSLHFIFGAQAGASPYNSGLDICIKPGQVSVIIDGKAVQTAAYDNGRLSIQKDQTILRVYSNQTLLIEYDIGYSISGTFSFVADNANVILDNIDVERH